MYIEQCIFLSRKQQISVNVCLYFDINLFLTSGFQEPIFIGPFLKEKINSQNTRAIFSRTIYVLLSSRALKLLEIDKNSINLV